MQEKTEEKDLIKRNENVSFFNKIRLFFSKIFRNKNNSNIISNSRENNVQAINNNDFKDSIKVNNEVEADDSLLELQRKLRAGEIKIEDLTEEQEDQLIDLYDKQIAVKKAKIEELKGKIQKLKKSVV